MLQVWKAESDMAGNMKGGIGKIFGKNGNLVVQGLYRTNQGTIPFDVQLPVRGIPDGPVDLTNPRIARAISKSETVIVQSVKQQKLQRAIKELVDRTRLGDQVAMAMLLTIRKRAEKGDPQAERSRRLVLAYIKKHPATQTQLDEIGFEKTAGRLRRRFAQGFNSGIQALCRCCLPFLACAGIVESSKGEVQSKLARINGEEREDYSKGLKNWRKAQSSPQPWTRLGGVVGLIRELNATRKGGPISKLSPMAAWELGE